jgi:hypothetical protein
MNATEYFEYLMALKEEVMAIDYKGPFVHGNPIDAEK